MKRFILFAFDSHYPSGGLGDVHGSYDTLAEAIAVAGNSGYADHRHIFDCETRQEVWSQ